MPCFSPFLAGPKNPLSSRRLGRAPAGLPSAGTLRRASLLHYQGAALEGSALPWKRDVRVSHPGAGPRAPPRARRLPAVPQHRRRRRRRPPPFPGTGSPEPCPPHPASQAASGKSCRGCVLIRICLGLIK